MAQGSTYMKMTMSFKNVKNSSRLERVVTEKTKRMAKFFEGQTSIAWSFSKSDGGVVIDVKMSGPSFHYHAHSRTDNLYKGIDATITKIERQVKKKKEKIKNRMHRGKGMKEDNVLQFRPKQQWELEEQEYNESIDKAA